MILFNRQNGIVKIEMNENDAQDLAGLFIDPQDNGAQFLNLQQKSWLEELPGLLLEKDSPNSEEDALVNPEYFLDTVTGDMMLINWRRNIPVGPNWVKVSSVIWDRLCGMKGLG